MTIKIARKECMVVRNDYFRTIVSMSKEDKEFIMENNLSLTKITREAIKSLRKENELKEFNKTR